MVQKLAHKKISSQKRQVAKIVHICPAHPNVNGLKTTKLVFLPPNTTSHTHADRPGHN